jgi:hypothetical protein
MPIGAGLERPGKLTGMVRRASRASDVSSLDRRTEPRRIALGVALLIVAVAWPVLNIGPRSRTLVSIGWTHGVEALDLLAMIPFVLAMVVVLPVWRRR